MGRQLLDEPRGGLLGQRALHVRLLQFAEAEIALELRAGIDGRAAAHLAQHAGPFEVVEVAVDGHFRDAEARRDVVEFDGPAFDEKIDDLLPALFPFHGFSPAFPLWVFHNIVSDKM